MQPLRAGRTQRAALARSATFSAAPSTSTVHGCGLPVRARGDTRVASLHSAAPLAVAPFTTTSRWRRSSVETPRGTRHARQLILSRLASGKRVRFCIFCCRSDPVLVCMEMSSQSAGRRRQVACQKFPEPDLVHANDATKQFAGICIVYGGMRLASSHGMAVSHAPGSMRNVLVNGAARRASRECTVHKCSCSVRSLFSTHEPRQLRLVRHRACRLATHHRPVLQSGLLCSDDAGKRLDAMPHQFCIHRAPASRAAQHRDHVAVIQEGHEAVVGMDGFRPLLEGIVLYKGNVAATGLHSPTNNKWMAPIIKQAHEREHPPPFPHSAKFAEEGRPRRADTRTASLRVAEACRGMPRRHARGLQGHPFQLEPEANWNAWSNLSAHSREWQVASGRWFKTKRQRPSPLAIPRRPPSALRKAVRRALHTSAGTRACMTSVWPAAR